MAPLPLSASSTSFSLRIVTTLSACKYRLARFGGSALGSSYREVPRRLLALDESAGYPYHLFGGRRRA
jgi:hypothetical protein